MGICESFHHGNNFYKNEVRKVNIPEINESQQTFEYQNVNIGESDIRPGTSMQTDVNNNAIAEQENKNGKKPELVQYDRECSYYNTKTNKTSMASSGPSEEEIIIRGEINKEAKNKEEDFANTSFKKLIKNKGGIIIKNEEQNNTLRESQNTNSIFELGKETISEICSKQTVSIYNTETDNKENKGIISGKYDINGKLIPKGNFHVKLDDIYENGKKSNSNRNLIGINNNKLRESNRINISLHESCPRVDSFLYIPKIDQPPPDLDELSGSLLNNSLISGK